MMLSFSVCDSGLLYKTTSKITCVKMEKSSGKKLSGKKEYSI